MPQYILSITARDRSGIVAGVSQAIFELSGNIQAASQTVHQGYFAMIVLCSLEQEHTPEAVGEKIRALAGEDLHVYAIPYQANSVSPVPADQIFILTSVGPDQPGILRSLTRYLASKKINIDDLYCCIKNSEFIVICQVTIPKDLDVSMLQMDLEAVGRERGFEVNLQHENIFTATNELRLGRMK